MSITTETYQPADLIAGDHPIRTEVVTLTGGAPLTRGAVLGRISADFRYQLSAIAAGDGSEVARAVLAHDADPSGGDVSVVVYRAADVDANKLSLGVGHTVASVRAQLGDFSIYVRDSVEAPAAP